MRGFLIFMLFAFGLVFLGGYCESKLHPLEFGSHWDYRISCENGFVFKFVDRTAIPILNKDGSNMTCDQLREILKNEKSNEQTY